MLRLIAALVLAPSLALASGGHEAPKGVPPAEALKKLVEGNKRFVENQAVHPHQSEGTRKEVAKGQHPFAAIVACSDSRVAPEVIFDEGLGDLFVIREAGNAPDDHGIASIEYAVEHLGVNLVVVLGHVSCGALKATLDTPAGESAGSPHLDHLVGALRPHLHLTAAERKEPGIPAAARQNAEASARELVEASNLLMARTQSGQLAVVPALYDLDTGKVTFLLPDPKPAVKAGSKPKSP